MATRRRVAPVWLVTSMGAAAVGIALAGAAPAGSAASIAVRVVARDFSFELSRRSVPLGSTVRFVVQNRGNTIHDFVVSGQRTRLLRPGGSQTITVRFPHRGKFTYLCSVSGHARLGMKGVFAVDSRAGPQSTPLPPVVAEDF